MLRGMTAYAVAYTPTPLGHCEGQLHCVNRKYLDIRIDLPSRLRPFEAQMRRHIANQIQRGQITLSLTLTFEEGNQKLKLNLPLVRQLSAVAKQMSGEVGFSCEECFHSILRTSQWPILSTEESFVEESVLKKNLFSLIDTLIISALRSKEEEGAAILEDLTPRVARLALSLAHIRQKASLLTDHFRSRLQERLLSVMEESNELKDRLLREVALYADRTDITEELSRFEHHHKKLEEELTSSQIASGKRIEFLLQELLREANTLSSKAGDHEIAQWVVDIKSEIEKIREQIQNVE